MMGRKMHATLTGVFEAEIYCGLWSVLGSTQHVKLGSFIFNFAVGLSNDLKIVLNPYGIVSLMNTL